MRTIPWILLTAALAIPVSGVACFCGPASTMYSYINADIVFEGVVTDIDDAAVTRFFEGKDHTERSYTMTAITFDVSHAWKGSTGTTSIVLQMDGSCSIGFVIGEEYLVFSSIMSELADQEARCHYIWAIEPVVRLHQTGLCSGTKIIAQASDDLAYLRRISEPCIESNIIIRPDEYNERIEAAQAAGEDWTRSPTTIAFELLGDDTEARETRIHVARHGVETNSETDVEVLRDGLAVDSSLGDWHRLKFRLLEDGTWRLKAVWRAYRCWRGSNPDVYTAELCP